MLDNIHFNIKKSKRKTLSIYVEREGTVTVIAPDHLSDQEIEGVIKKKEYRIYKSLAEWEVTNTSRVNREYVNGQSFLYLGKNYSLQIVNGDQEKPLILKNGHFLLRKKDRPNADQVFKEFYKEKAYPKITERVERFKKKINVNPKQVRIMELKNRWASCSEKGNLNFHWKCIIAPIDVLSYIIDHELVHLVHKNHTKAFWNEIDKVVPDFQRHIEWLRINGAAMDI